MKRANNISGVLVVNKPEGWTSHDVVGRARKLLNTGKVGHTGTLDPFATGVLVLCVGRALRLAEYLTHETKSYRATAVLGQTSSTGDPEGEIVTKITRPLPFQREFLQNKLNEFLGERTQVPPKYSAIKIDGKEAYKRARKGEEFEMPERKIKIFGMNLIKFEWPILEFKVKCSAGTYIRTLAEEVGESLGAGAYLKELMRTRVGKFTQKDMIELEEVTEASLLPTIKAVEGMTVVRVTPAEVSKLVLGQAIATTERYDQNPGPVILYDGQEVVGVAEYDAEKFLFKPKKILLTAE